IIVTKIFFMGLTHKHTQHTKKYFSSHNHHNVTKLLFSSHTHNSSQKNISSQNFYFHHRTIKNPKKYKFLKNLKNPKNPKNPKKRQKPQKPQKPPKTPKTPKTSFSPFSPQFRKTSFCTKNFIFHHQILHQTFISHTKIYFSPPKHSKTH